MHVTLMVQPLAESLLRNSIKRVTTQNLWLDSRSIGIPAWRIKGFSKAPY